MKTYIIIFLFFVGGLLAFGQSNTIIDVLLEEEQATWGTTAYLVLSAAQMLPENASAADAVVNLAEKGWYKEPGIPEEQIKLGEFSYMLMKAFDINGGVMYRIIPGPRYASRELYFKNIIRNHSNPSRTLTGEEAVDILRLLLEWKEARL